MDNGNGSWGCLIILITLGAGIYGFYNYGFLEGIGLSAICYFGLPMIFAIIVAILVTISRSR